MTTRTKQIQCYLRPIESKFGAILLYSMILTEYLFYEIQCNPKCIGNSNNTHIFCSSLFCSILTYNNYEY